MTDGTFKRPGHCTPFKTICFAEIILNPNFMGRKLSCLLIAKFHEKSSISSEKFVFYLLLSYIGMRFSS